MGPLTAIQLRKSGNDGWAADLVVVSFNKYDSTLDKVIDFKRIGIFSHIDIDPNNDPNYVYTYGNRQFDWLGRKKVEIEIYNPKTELVTRYTMYSMVVVGGVATAGISVVMLVAFFG